MANPGQTFQGATSQTSFRVLLECPSLQVQDYAQHMGLLNCSFESSFSIQQRPYVISPDLGILSGGQMFKSWMLTSLFSTYCKTWRKFKLTEGLLQLRCKTSLQNICLLFLTPRTGSIITIYFKTKYSDGSHESHLTVWTKAEIV